MTASAAPTASAAKRISYEVVSRITVEYQAEIITSADITQDQLQEHIGGLFLRDGCEVDVVQDLREAGIIAEVTDCYEGEVIEQEINVQGEGEPVE